MSVTDMGFWEWFGNYWWWALIVFLTMYGYLHDKPFRLIFFTLIPLGIGAQVAWDHSSWGLGLAWMFGLQFFLTVVFTELIVIVLVAAGLGTWIGYKNGG